MRAMTKAISIAALLLVAALQAAPAAATAPDLDALARRALAGGAASEEAVAALRRAGPEGMARALAAVEAEADLSPAQEAALDRVCGVRDCARIRLFWHTDFAAARAAARASGKPILSLRLLGRLDEDLSCANSRFFRSILYPDARIGRLLRQRFVLHWRSVRPVPKLTVDFGDGRTLERTLTGNSIHYVLDPDGRLVDALPGLYGPQVFLEELHNALRAAEEAAGLDDDAFASATAQYRWDRIAALSSALEEDEARVPGGGEAGRRIVTVSAEAVLATDREAVPAAEEPVAASAEAVPAAAETVPAAAPAVVAAAPSQEGPSGPPRNPWAILAATPGLPVDRVTPSEETGAKAIVEMPLLAAMDLEREDDGWLALAEVHRPGIRFDARSRAFILAKHGVGEGAAAERLLENLAATVALDEVLNQYRLRPRIYRRLWDLGTVPDVEELNAWVYAEVFQLPGDDPWLGLAPEGVYAALPAAGAGER